MADNYFYSYEPDHAIAPGETLSEVIENLELTQAELARRTGRPTKTINGIIKGNTAITPETALQFEKVLGVPAKFWLNMDSNYHHALALQHEDIALTQQADWLKKLPVNDIEKRGYVAKKENKADQVREVLSFYGVASIDSWEQMWDEKVALRKSGAYETDFEALTAWIRMVEIEAKKVACNPYNHDAFRDKLTKARELTTVRDPSLFSDKLIKQCAEAGVAVVFMPEISGSRVSGVAKWLSPNKAMIGLSLRYKSNDQLWFAFFHEAAHILLHSKKSTFINEIKPQNNIQSKQEEEAGVFAADFLIPNEAYLTFTSSLIKGKVSRKHVEQFADDLGIAPGIVVGRLQHDGWLPYSHLNELKITYGVRE